MRHLSTAFHEAMKVIEAHSTPQSRALSSMTWSEAASALAWAGASGEATTFGRAVPPVRSLLNAGVVLTPELIAALVVVARAGCAAEQDSQRAISRLLGELAGETDSHPAAAWVETHLAEAAGAREAVRLLRVSRRSPGRRRARRSAAC